MRDSDVIRVQSVLIRFRLLGYSLYSPCALINHNNQFSQCSVLRIYTKSPEVKSERTTQQKPRLHYGRVVAIGV